MRFDIVHTTTYTYSERVFLEPLTIRMHPRDDGWQRVVSHELSVAPEPDGLTDGLDASGNHAAWMWFSGEHQSLEIVASSVVETLRSDPFDYVIPKAALDHLPVPYPEAERASLAPYTHPAGAAHEVVELAQEVAEKAKQQLRRFLFDLTAVIYDTCEAIDRLTGDPLPAERTLAERSGSCRDLAVLYVECCRVMGIAARFVSGYQEGDPDTSERHLHAWAEAYVPGGGWRGYDPTHGLAVADRHVALAAAPTARGAAPSVGSFRRSGATAKMDVDLKITVR